MPWQKPYRYLGVDNNTFEVEGGVILNKMSCKHTCTTTFMQTNIAEKIISRTFSEPRKARYMEKIIMHTRLVNVYSNDRYD